MSRVQVVTAILVGLLATGCGATPPPVVVTTVLAGQPVPDRPIVSIDGVSLVAPDQLGPLPDGPLDPAAPDRLRQLVVSNYLPETGGYSGDLGRAMLTDTADRATVTNQLVEVASGFDAVQVSLFKLASQDSPALVDFTAELRDALPEDTSLVVTVIASTDFGGYRERGIDLEALAEHVDRFVLQTYEPAEAGVPPDPIEDLAGLVEEIDYLTSQIDAEHVDLGVSPLAGVDSKQGLELATEAGLHGLVVGAAGQPEASVTPS